MQNKDIERKMLYFEKSFEDFKSTLIKEVSIMEDTLNKEKKLNKFKRIILSNIYIKYNSTENKIYIGGFENYYEAQNFVMYGFSLVSYSGTLQYKLKSSNPFSLNKELNELKVIFLNILEKIYEIDLPSCNENSIISKNNKDVYVNLIKYIEMLGFKTSYMGKKSARHKRTESIEYNFVSELKSQANSHWTDGFALKLKNDLISKYDTMCLEIIEKFNLKMKNELSIAESKYYSGETVMDDTSLEVLLIELDKLKLDGLIHLPYRNGILDILKIKEKILSINKLLEIGYLLEINRNKIDCGTLYANKGLDILKSLIIPKSDSKKLNFVNSLIVELEKNINNYKDDGRIFRDMKHNYKEIYNYVCEENNIDSFTLSNVLNRIIEIELKVGLL